jgi:hypothetical protein
MHARDKAAACVEKAKQSKTKPLVQQSEAQLEHKGPMVDLYHPCAQTKGTRNAPVGSAGHVCSACALGVRVETVTLEQRGVFRACGRSWLVRSRSWASLGPLQAGSRNVVERRCHYCGASQSRVATWQRAIQYGSRLRCDALRCAAMRCDARQVTSVVEGNETRGGR